jgi:ABC-type transport system involved in cytochrome c biogenesis permease component
MTIQTSAMRTNFSTMLASTRMRVLTISRYPGQLAMDIFIPIVFAAMPILLGRATAGDQAAAVFEANTGTANYVGYMIIGSSAFAMVSYAFWHIAYWVRWEMETGTLESLYLTPTSRMWVASGVALYSLMRSLFSALTSYFVGSWIMGVDPFQGELLIALLFLVVGAIPLYGVSLLFGALVFKAQRCQCADQCDAVGGFVPDGHLFPGGHVPAAAQAGGIGFPAYLDDQRGALRLVGRGFLLWRVVLGPGDAVGLHACCSAARLRRIQPGGEWDPEE